MRVVLDTGETLDLGETEATPTIGIVDYSRRVTDDYGVTTVVERGFARRMSVRLVVPFEQTDALQASLAAIRAKPARWIADEGVEWLDFRGFFKDFEIDLPVPPKAYCTLTVEALTATEAFTDPGGDPAPLGHASTLQLLQPATIEGGALVATSVPENDYPEWSADTTYPLGARVIKAATHRIYESGAIGNKGNDPAGVSGKWRDIGPTNRWAMFDQALGSTTTAAGQITVTLAAGAINAAALLDVKAATVRVQAAGYDRTVAPNAAGTVIFLDLPGTGGQVTVTITGPGTVGVGTLLVGKLVGLGSTTDDAKAGITDFSRKEADEFGEIQVVERAWAKRMTLPAKIRRDAIDLVAGRIAAVRAKPSLWIGKEGMETLTVYAFFKDFSIAVDTTICTLSLSIEGLSTAGKVEPLTASVDWPDVGDPVGTKPEDNATVGAPAGTEVAGKPAEEIVGQLEEQDEALAQLDTDIAKATINIAAAQDTIAQMQVDAAATKADLEEDISSLNATAAQIQADAAGTRASLETAQAEILAAGGRINTIESTLGDQDASINSIAQTVSNHTGRLASIDTTLSANGASISQNAQAISAVQGNLASLSSTVSTQGASITQNAQAITTANQSIASLTTRVGTAESSISQNATAISGVSGRTATLESTVSAHGTSITQNAQAISTTQGNLASLSSTVTSQGSSITQLQTASSTQAGQIATLNTQVTAGLQNLLPNGDFSNGLNGYVSSGAGGWEIQDQWSGRRCVTNASGIPQLLSSRFVVNPGTSITAGARTQDNRASNKMFMQLVFYTSSDVLHSFGPNVSFTSALSRVSVTATVPTGAVYGRVYFNAAAASSGYVEINNITVVPGSVDVPSATPTASVAQSFAAISTLNTQYATLSTTVSTQGSSITQAQTAITNLNSSTATLNTQVSSGVQNLVPNGDFSNGLNDWIVGGAGSWVVSAEWSGRRCTTGAAGVPTLLSPRFPVNAGSSVTAGVLAQDNRAANPMYMQFRFEDANGGNLSYTSSISLAGNLSRKSATTVVPAGAAYCRLWFSAAGNSSGYVEINNLTAVIGTVDVPTAASVATSAMAFQTINTLNTQYAALSSTVSTQGVTVSQHSTAITTINSNITSIMGRWGVEIDANGYVSGIALNNNGARADFAIRADRFKMVPPGGNGSDGKYIVVDGNGRTTDYILYQGVRVVEMGWRD